MPKPPFIPSPLSSLSPRSRKRSALRPYLNAFLLGSACLLFALHYVHLTADFPNNSPWMDWSKYTDEGWYGDAAIRQLQRGHWYLPGDFNPAAALPVWPLLELALFRITGVSLVAARALTVSVFGLTLVASYLLLRRHRTTPGSLAPAAAVLLLAANPFCYVFTRLAILEPLLILLTVLALLVASSRCFIPQTVFRAIPGSGSEPGPDSKSDSKFDSKSDSRPDRNPDRDPVRLLHGSATPKLASRRDSYPEAHYLPAESHTGSNPHFSRLLAQAALGLLLPAMVLTKTTAVFLLPSIAWMLWVTSGRHLRPFLRNALPAAALAITLWLAYFTGVVRPYLLDDYRYLFSANGYTRISLATAPSVLASTLLAGRWIGPLLFPLGVAAALWTLFKALRRRRSASPLAPVLLLWVAGYLAFLAYHDNLQPRYYLVVAVPLTLLVCVVSEVVSEVVGEVVGEQVLPQLTDQLLKLSYLSPGLFRSRLFKKNRATRSASDHRRGLALIVNSVAAAMLLAVVGTQGRQTLEFVLHPEYTFTSAAASLRRVVLADPTHSPLILSISGSNLSLMTGLPSICDDFGTMELAGRIATYRPGWYAAWNQVDDDKMDALSTRYSLHRVAEFPAFDDPERNLLILYRLDPTTSSVTHARPRRRLARHLTGAQSDQSFSQKPSQTQLEH